MKEEELYWRIDQEEDMSDEEKRKAYFSELCQQEDYQQWCDEQ